MHRSTFDDDEAPALFGSALTPKRGIFGKGGLLGAPVIPDYDAPQWGGERGFRSIELKLLLGAGAVGGGLIYGAINTFVG